MFIIIRIDYYKHFGIYNNRLVYERLRNSIDLLLYK